MDYFEKSLVLHKHLKGKWEINSRFPLENADDLSVAYTPGVASVCESIAKDTSMAYDLTMKGNTVAIVSDGSAVLGLGDIGPVPNRPPHHSCTLLSQPYTSPIASGSS